jgi:hypothetical protein
MVAKQKCPSCYWRDSIKFSKSLIIPWQYLDLIKVRQEDFVYQEEIAFYWRATVAPFLVLMFWTHMITGKACTLVHTLFQIIIVPI